MNIEIFSRLFSEYKYREKNDENYYVFDLLKPIEARLMDYDTVILASMNEGDWPKAINQDIWLNQRSREDLGLSPKSRRIGQSSLDFTILLNSKKVIITRSKKIEGQYTNESRMISRIKLLYNKLDNYDNLLPKKPWKEWIKNDLVINEKKENPSFLIKKDYIPNKFSATDIEKIINNPYSFCAEKILKLKKLAKIDKKFGQLEFGILIHKIFEIFLLEKTYNKNNFLQTSNRILKDYLKDINFYYLWYPQINNIAEIFTQFSINLENNHISTEHDSEISIKGFTIKSIADLIVFQDLENISIYDFKTGTIPTNKSVEEFLSPQMLIQTLVLNNKYKVNSANYIQIKSSNKSYLKSTINLSILPDFIIFLEDILNKLKQDATFEYKKSHHSDYELLARKLYQLS